MLFMGFDDEEREENHIQRRMMWDHVTMTGKLMIDGGGAKSLLDFIGGREWDCETEYQRFCDWWQSHVKKDGKCALCGAKYIGR